jgi:hypothetical protein
MSDIVATIPSAQISESCRRWRIRELAVFGSALRHDFGADSEIDIMVEFAVDADWGLVDHAQMQEDLGQLLGRKVDLVTKRALQRSENRCFPSKMHHEETWNV